MSKSPNCKRCGGHLVDSIAPLSGTRLRYCPNCHRIKRRANERQRPEVKRAHRAVGKALKTGQLVRQPCEICGNPQTEAHHGNYAQALQVQWLCRLHHRQLHTALRKAGALANRG